MNQTPQHLPATPYGTAKPVVLVAPDSFKGTFDATQVAQAMAEGVRRFGGRPDMSPLADGGEGTLAVLHKHLGGQLITVPTHDPVARPIHAEYLRIDRDTAVVESARASGLDLVADRNGYAEQASTYGTGELLVAAARAGATSILLTVGGSATTDGGTGALAAIYHGGGLHRAHIQILCDVETPFEAAATIYGPQKGATPGLVASLTDRLEKVATELSRDPRGVACTGCAGGLSGALWANHDAALMSGADVVMEHTGFSARAAAAALVITGEGAVDQQTLQGKLVMRVTQRAHRLGRPTAVVAGRVHLSEPEAQLGAAGIRCASTLEQVAAATQALCEAILG